MDVILSVTTTISLEMVFLEVLVVHQEVVVVEEEEVVVHFAVMLIQFLHHHVD